MQGRAVGERGPLARQQRLHPGDQRIAWLEAVELGLGRAECRGRWGRPWPPPRARPRPRPCGRTRRRARLCWRPRPAGQAPPGDGAVIGRKRRLELAHRLKDLTHRVVRLRAFRRGEGGAPGGVERLFEAVQLLQRLRARRERPRMRGREGEERVECRQRVGMAMPRSVDRCEVDVGVGEPRTEFDRASRHDSARSYSPWS